MVQRNCRQVGSWILPPETRLCISFRVQLRLYKWPGRRKMQVLLVGRGQGPSLTVWLCLMLFSHSSLSCVEDPLQVKSSGLKGGWCQTFETLAPGAGDTGIQPVLFICSFMVFSFADSAASLWVTAQGHEHQLLRGYNHRARTGATRAANSFLQAVKRVVAPRHPSGLAVVHFGNGGDPWRLQTLQGSAAWDLMPARASSLTTKSVSFSRQNALLLYTNVKPNLILFESMKL